MKVDDNLKEKFRTFLPIFTNTLFPCSDIGEFMKEYAEETKLLIQPQRMLTSSFHLTNRTITTLFFRFHLNLGLERTQIRRFVQYTPMRCFNSFVQSAVKARRLSDGNPHSGVLAETIKLLAKSSYGHQIMDTSRQTFTKYLNDEKVHKAINSKTFEIKLPQR